MRNATRTGEEREVASHVNEFGVPGTAFGVRWPYAYGADKLTTLDRFEGTVPGGCRSTRAELLTRLAAAGGRRRHSAARPSTAPASGELMACDAVVTGPRPGGPPTAPSVAAACCSDCVVAEGAGLIGGIVDAKLGATEGATAALAGR